MRQKCYSERLWLKFLSFFFSTISQNKNKLSTRAIFQSVMEFVWIFWACLTCSSSRQTAILSLEHSWSCIYHLQMNRRNWLFGSKSPVIFGSIELFWYNEDTVPEWRHRMLASVFKSLCNESQKCKLTVPSYHFSSRGLVRQRFGVFSHSERAFVLGYADVFLKTIPCLRQKALSIICSTAEFINFKFYYLLLSWMFCIALLMQNCIQWRRIWFGVRIGLGYPALSWLPRNDWCQILQYCQQFYVLVSQCRNQK